VFRWLLYTIYIVYLQYRNTEKQNKMSQTHYNDTKIHLSRVTRMYLNENGKVKVKVNSRITTSCGKTLNGEASTMVRFSETPLKNRCINCNKSFNDLMLESKKLN